MKCDECPLRARIPSRDDWCPVNPFTPATRNAWGASPGGGEMLKERVLECLDQVLADPHGNISVGQSMAIALAIRIIDEQASDRWSYFSDDE